MTFAQLVAEALAARSVTDAFGIPGAVLLDFLYQAAEKGVRPRMAYNEQSAAFSACGYAQEKGWGCAFATKGPGATNLLTGMADAHCEGARVLFLTAHAGPRDRGGRRLATNQEVDVVAMASPVAVVRSPASSMLIRLRLSPVVVWYALAPLLTIVGIPDMILSMEFMLVSTSPEVVTRASTRSTITGRKKLV